MSDSFTLGKFTVYVALRPDNPAFASYRVFIGERLIGKQFSVPSITDCEWLEREGRYAENSCSFERSASQSSSAHDRRCRAGAAPASRNGRPRKLAPA